VASAEDPKQDHEIAHTPPLVERRFYAEGEVWSVREVAAPAFDRRGGMHLIFESASIVRRVREYPPDWILLSDEELYALSQRV
jgi:hypothetical protein